MGADRSAVGWAHDFESMVESIPAIVFIAGMDVSGTWEYVNSWIEPILGFSPREWLATPGIWAARLHPDDRERVLAGARRGAGEAGDAIAAEDLERSSSFVAEYRMLHRDGHTVWMRGNHSLAPAPDGTMVWYGVLIDVSEEKQAQLELERRTEAQAAVARLGRHGLAGRPIDELAREACRAITEVLGAARAIIGNVREGSESLDVHTFVSWPVEPEPRRLRRTLGMRTPAGYTLMTGLPLMLADWDAESQFTPDEFLYGLGVRSSVCIRIEGPDRPWGVIGAFATQRGAFSEHDVNFVTSLANTLSDALARQWADAAMEHRALHDPLTGLPNRELFSDRLTHALERARRQAGSLSALLFLDLDHFKQINDTLGHHAGDQLLTEVAARLREVLRPTDTVARLSGDEFALLLEDVASERDVIATAERIASLFARPFALAAGSQFVTTSIGIALASGQEDAAALLSDADAAMYRAKQRGRARYDLFDDNLRTRENARARLESDLQRALDRGELRLEYQPLVWASTEKVMGVEALLRWDHPERGLIMPAEFIQVANESGLINRIGQWVAAQTLRDGTRWARQHPDLKPLRLGFNASIQELRNPHFAEQLGAVIESSGVSADHVNLELDEYLLRDDAERIHDELWEVKRLGVRLVIHDFGTGAASLTQLATLPIDAIKVDRRFIGGIDTDDAAARIARAVVATGTSLGLTVVGAGIETVAQARILRDLGVTVSQGYLYSKPVDAAAIDAILADPGCLRRTLP